MKQVLVIRKDLNMRKGKMIVQGAHASIMAIGAVLEALNNKGSGLQDDAPLLRMDNTLNINEWLRGDQKKVCVSVSSESELLAIYAAAEEKGLPCALVRDLGLTEFGGVATYTAVAIGPDVDAKVDVITGALPLL